MKKSDNISTTTSPSPLALLETLTLEKTLQYLTPRAKDSHKGDFGHVLIVGGDYGMGGAVFLAGKAALRTGAGRVSIATRSEHAFAILSAYPELMCHAISDAFDLTPLLSTATVVIIGPGLGRKEWGCTLLKQVINAKLPLIVDADALYLLANFSPKRNFLQPNSLQPKAWILTPHPGEAATLLNTTTERIQSNRSQAIIELQQRYNGVIVLKGAGSLVLGSSSNNFNNAANNSNNDTYITNEPPRLHQCLLGNPGMSTAGMGDVLSGIIASLVAQGLSLENAAKLGICVHAAAGGKAAEAEGERGMIASDLLPFIRNLLNLF